MKYLKVNLTIFGIQLKSSHSSQSDLLTLLTYKHWPDYPFLPLTIEILLVLQDPDQIPCPV